jgi:cytochrome P450
LLFAAVSHPNMNELFSVEARRNPYPLYDQLRRVSPVLQDSESRLWMLFDYESVRRALNDHESFSSRLGPAEWIVFLDPPRHTKLRALVSQGFSPRVIAGLEPRIRAIATRLLEQASAAGEMDLVGDFSARLPMMVIAEMLGVPTADEGDFRRWNQVLLAMSLTLPGGPDAGRAKKDFLAASAEMESYLRAHVAQRQSAPTDDLLSRLAQAEVEGERLSPPELLGFFQLLLLAGTETTTNLISNAVLSFIENPGQLALVREKPELLPPALEEVLRYRSPVQWMFRVAKRELELHGKTIPAGAVVLAMIGSANRDPNLFNEPDRFDIGRQPNPHIAFGHGIHSCLGAALGRLEAKIALAEFLRRAEDFSLATTAPWPPGHGLHVHGPARLPLRVAWTAAPEQR